MSYEHDRETERLLIRRFMPDDGPDLYAYLSQEAVVRYEPYGLYSEEAAIREAARRASDQGFWAVCLRDTGRLIGNLYLAERDFGTWELGYVFNADFQGCGYAQEAARALIDDVFRRGAHRVVALCNPLNEASWRLLERLAFRREGHQIKNVFFKTDSAGRPLWADTYEYAVLAEEWLAWCSPAGAAQKTPRESAAIWARHIAVTQDNTEPPPACPQTSVV